MTAVTARSGLRFARHSHDEFGIGLIVAGAHRSWSGRGQVEAVQGDLITVNPGEIHDGAPVGTERAWSMLYVAPALIAAIAADASEGRIVARELDAPVIRDARLARGFSRSWAAAVGPAADPADLEAALLHLCAALLRLAPASPPAAPHRLAQARERIDDDPAAPHALADLATLTGVSRFQVLRGFTQMTGMTPHSYVIQRRIELARRRVRSGATLADAAVEAGFADQSHFHRAFMARYGLTPGTYAAAFGR